MTRSLKKMLSGVTKIVLKLTYGAWLLFFVNSFLASLSSAETQIVNLHFNRQLSHRNFSKILPTDWIQLIDRYNLCCITYYRTGGATYHLIDFINGNLYQGGRDIKGSDIIANKKLGDFLTRIAQIDANNRMSVMDALSHPFLLEVHPWQKESIGENEAIDNDLKSSIYELIKSARADKQSPAFGDEKFSAGLTSPVTKVDDDDDGVEEEDSKKNIKEPTTADSYKSE
ncbi:hypothetical protein PMAYCL1PPCAC_10987 [Pristionchus mayeri]|uniref:Protein kinase n=1 Tax=Pristionchus mayeri TaxID=1317129 RepID=A0AAN4ZGI9_9BILA|nr:hypothetical protein PMAYCL1PPCAC_10987 [Pristionchus mayeri]